MCGICGGTDGSDVNIVRRMALMLVHRGPDDEGFYVDQGIVLGNRRLSIIDIAGGRQPIHNEDQTIWCVNNGEIYNYPELRRALQERGHRFYTESDTEVLVHAYETYDLQFPTQLNGMFACAIWDAQRRRLILARDPVGIKPLFYRQTTKGTLWFASEVKALLLVEEHAPTVDPIALHALFNLGYVPAERTLFEGIRKLLPGHIMKWENTEIAIQPYWTLPLRSEQLPYGNAVDRLAEILHHAVERHLVSDVPVGAFLSSGLDTSTIVALASRMYARKLATFTLGFGEVTDELGPARATAELFGTDHYENVLEIKELTQHLPHLIWHADAPKFNLYPYFIAEFASRHVKVVLSGMGGDELFGGYVHRYRHFTRAEGIRELRLARAGAWAARTLSILVRDRRRRFHRQLQALQAASDPELFFLRVHGVLAPDEWAKVGGQALNPTNEQYLRYSLGSSFREVTGLMEGVLRAEFRTKLVDDFLLVDDAMTMAHGLEERVPLLDRELVEFAFRLPVNYKIRDGVGKYVFRDAVAKILPQQIRERTKRGFSMDLSKWFEGEILELAQQVVTEGHLVREGYLRADYVRKLLSRPTDDREARLAWLATLGELWYRMYIVAGIRTEPMSLDALL